MRAKLPTVRADVIVLGDQAYCKLINMTGHFVRFRLPKATVKVPGNTVANVVADFVDGFSVSTEEHGLLFGDDVKTTRGGQPWNVRNMVGEQAPPPALRPPAPVEPEPQVEVETPVIEPKAVVEVEAFDAADLTVAEVLEWVGTDSVRKAKALKSERKGKARKSLLATLSA
jgi:hypothetical protein